MLKSFKEENSLSGAVGELNAYKIIFIFWYFFI
jgi:hypothetical protein